MNHKSTQSCRANVELTCTVRDECTSFVFDGYAGTVAKNFNENTTYVLFPPGVSYQSVLLSLESTPSEAVHLVSIGSLLVLANENQFRRKILRYRGISFVLLTAFSKISAPNIAFLAF